MTPGPTCRASSTEARPQDGGIEVGDVIVAVDGSDVRSFEQLRGVISAYSPGDTVTVEVVRDGQRQSLEVTLGTLTPSVAAPRRPAEPRPDAVDPRRPCRARRGRQ